MAERTHMVGLTDGAAEGAPTAPHATPRAGRGRASGPERFWDRRRARIALGVAFALSAAVHYAVNPIELFPSGFDINDTDGEATIPIDLIEDQAPPAVQQEQVEGPDKPEQEDPNGAYAGKAATTQTGVRFDAGVDASRLFVQEDGGPSDAATDGGADASDGGTTDPVALAEAVKAGDPLVLLVLNMDTIKTHPVGQKLGGLLSAIPQWDDFMSGTNIDPVRDADWVMISGPSLKDTKKDIILVHYSAPDDVVDHALDVVAHKWSQGGPYDAGVPGVRSVVGHADGAPRVFLRPQPHLIAVVPVDVAHNNAVLLARRTVSPPIHPGEAFTMRLLYPQHVFPDLPATVKVVRLHVFPKDDGSADVEAEGDCGTPDEATAAAAQIGSTVHQYSDSMIVQMLTHGLLSSVQVTSTGAQVKLTMHATEDQLTTLLSLVSDKIADLKAGGSPAVPPPPPAPAPRPGAPR